jgi:hypothetical protein
MASPTSSGDSPHLPSPNPSPERTNPVPSFPIRWDEQEWGTNPKIDKPQTDDEDISNLLDEAFLGSGKSLGRVSEDDEDSDASLRYILEEESDNDVEIAEIFDEDEPPEDYKNFWGDFDINDVDNDEVDEVEHDGAERSDDDSNGNSSGDDAVIAIPPRRRRLRRVD